MSIPKAIDVGAFVSDLDDRCADVRPATPTTAAAQSPRLFPKGPTMAHPDEDLARQAYKAFAEGDMATLDSIMADDVQWHVAGDSVISGDYDGKQAVFEFFRQLSDRSGGTFSLDIHDIVANDNHTVALVKSRGERDGRRIEDNSVHVMHIEDGRVVSFWSFQWDQQATTAFWE